MPRNVEIKARVSNIDELLKLAKEVSNSSGEVLEQEDTFYVVKKGRMKLRDEVNQNGKESWLLYYERADSEGPRLCQYKKVPVPNNTDGLQKLLSGALGEKGKVKKTRHLFMVGQTRVHVDQVENLGTFMELEVVLEDDETEEQGQEVAKLLMKKLNISEEDLVNVAYTDLLMDQ